MILTIGYLTHSMIINNIIRYIPLQHLKDTRRYDCFGTVVNTGCSPFLYTITATSATVATIHTMTIAEIDPINTTEFPLKTTEPSVSVKD